MDVQFKNKKYVVLLQGSEMSAVSHFINLIKDARELSSLILFIQY